MKQISLFIILIVVSYAWAQKELIKMLLSDYDRESRPVKDPLKPVNVTMFPWISYIQVEEPEESLKYLHLLEMSWNDEFLQWIYSALLTCCMLYFTTCDITYGAIATTSQQVLLYSHQTPDDDIKDTIKISSQYDLIEFKTTRIQTETINQGSVKAKVSDFIGEKATVDLINLRFAFKRKPDYYNYVLAFPGFLVTLICIDGLFSPFNTDGVRQEKISFGLTALLALAIMLQMVADAVPKSAEGLPFLGEFLLLQLLVCAVVGTIFTVVIMHVHKTAIDRKWIVPDWLLQISCSKIDKPKTGEKMTLFEENLQTETVKIFTYPTHVDSHTNGTLRQVLQSVKLCLKNLDKIKGIMAESDSDSTNEHLWNIVFDRIDLLFVLLYFQFWFLLSPL